MAHDSLLDRATKLIESKHDPDELNADGLTLLHEAVPIGDIPTIEYLIANNINVNKKNRYGNTALNYAIWHRHMDIVKILLDGGADKEILDWNGKTAAELAMDEKLYDMAEYIELYVSVPTKGVHE